MRALLSAVGTRGDVQPLLAVGLKVRELGHQVRLAIPPNFVAWARELGFEASPVGVEMRAPPSRANAPPLTPEELKRLRETMPDLISDQFVAVGAAAEGCDVILGGNAHQYAARSIAELRGIPHFAAVYAPVAIPSPNHAPPAIPGQRWAPGPPPPHAQLWADTLRSWNERALERVNHNRARLGLSPITDVLTHNLTDHPWLATDPLLGPAPKTSGVEVFQTGTWFLDDTTPLPPEVEAFLEAGEPPVYLGFGSMPASSGTGRALSEAARAVGRRAILARGWAELEAPGESKDVLVIGDVNQQTLFPRTCAVVHHGGAGTTATAARAGVPQVLIPQFSDQFYWASRLIALGIGGSLTGLEGKLTGDALQMMLRGILDPAVTDAARAVAAQVGTDGAMIAARRLVAG